MEQQYLIALFIIIVVGFLFQQLIDYLNNHNRPKLVPEQLKEFYDQDEYSRSRAYRLENYRLSNAGSWLTFIITLGFLLSGGFGWLNEFLASFGLREKWLSLGYFASLFLISDIISLPFSLYGTFIIEEKYGFNRTTFKTFLLDKLKGYLLAILVGGLLVYLLLSIIITLGSDFWIYAWILMVAIMLFMNFFYTTLFLPIFNKLTPLEDGELKTSIVELAGKVNFPLNKIYVMDASKRSSKSNAFFSGFGKLKSIVLFDTLIEKHSKDELLGILAHEVGHYKKKHTIVNIISGMLVNGIMLYLLTWFLFGDGSSELSKAMGGDRFYYHLNIIAFGILFEPVNMVIGIASNVLSRKHEYEADAYAIAHADSEAFQNALKKLSVENLSDLQPHPAHVFVHYSHPTLLQRLEAIDSLKGDSHKS